MKLELVLPTYYNLYGVSRSLILSAVVTGSTSTATVTASALPISLGGLFPKPQIQSEDPFEYVFRRESL